jgi:hypothetical protein
MAEEQEKLIEKDRAIPTAVDGKDALSDKDVESVAGGCGYQDGEDGTMRTRPGKA